MEQVNSPARVQLKQKLLNLLKAAPSAGMVLASATLSLSAVDAGMTRIESRLSIEDRVANVRSQAEKQAPHTAIPSTGRSPFENLLAWGNWHNWHNGWHNGWHNWHNWHNW